MNTKEAFNHFLNNGYKAIKPKPSHLRVAKNRFSRNLLSEEKMISLLSEFGYKPKSWKSIPETWHEPK